ncbi:hypothetical protein, partial [Vibrio parahaemolyticus]|uniref:hypothetical protein n=1 Tax=Vibrio parahaemolyticus TaxID=670 RepID=UPI0021519C86
LRPSYVTAVLYHDVFINLGTMIASPIPLLRRLNRTDKHTQIVVSWLLGELLFQSISVLSCFKREVIHEKPMWSGR